jgi:signal transduction histidine kinase
MRLVSKPRIVIQRKIAWLMVFSILSLMVVGYLIYATKRNLGKTNFQISRTYDVIGVLQRLDFIGAQSGAAAYRYLESGDADAVREMRDSHLQLQHSLDSLQKMTRKNCDQDSTISILAEQIDARDRAEDSLYDGFFINPAAAAAPESISLSSTAPLPAALAAGPAVRIATETRLAGADHRLRTLLERMTVTERGLLNDRKQLNDSENRRTALVALIARIAGCIFVVFILVKINNDITHRRHVQEQLEMAISEAREAKQMQEQFLANMSHEIRTPMNGIKGMTDLLLSTPLSTKQHELAEVIKRSVNNLLVIVGDILDFSKIKAGKLNIEKITFSVADVLANAAAIFEHRLKKERLELITNIDPAVPQWLIGDPHRLNQVLINLLGNAIKFTDQGHIQVDLAVHQRTEAEITLAFTVKDTGIGIPESSLPHIFDSFSQGSRDTSRLYGGTGLGLTICKQLLHLQGGEISVSSTIGNGTSFQFYLPFGISEDAASDRSAAEITLDYSKLLVGKRFLVAEDNEINQKLIDYVLRKAGGTVELFNNGADAIRHLERDRVFDLIIMDLQMPEMDGYATTRYIRNDLKMQTPIIAMTATAMKGEQLQCLESGMNEYMTKPFEFAELYKRIGILLAS